MRTLYPQMTKREQQIADYVLANQQVIYKSITEVVEHSGIGYGSIVRFCQRLGYDGFQDFKIHLSQDLARERPAEEKGEANILAQLADQCGQDIQSTVELLSPEELDGAAKSIAAADQILVAGHAGSFVTAKEIEYRLIRSGMKASADADNHLQRARAAVLTRKDAAVLVSFTGSTKEILALGQIVRKRGAKIICITNHAKSPLAMLADYRLLTAVKADALQAEVVSKTATMFVVDALFHRIGQIRKSLRNALIETYAAVSDRQL